MNFISLLSHTSQVDIVIDLKKSMIKTCSECFYWTMNKKTKGMRIYIYIALSSFSNHCITCCSVLYQQCSAFVNQGSANESTSHYKWSAPHASVVVCRHDSAAGHLYSYSASWAAWSLLQIGQWEWIFWCVFEHGPQRAFALMMSHCALEPPFPWTEWQCLLIIHLHLIDCTACDWD